MLILVADKTVVCPLFAVQLDTLLADWAATAGLPDMAARAAQHGYVLTSNLAPAWQQKLTLLETFNGSTFYKMPWDTLNAQSGVTGMSVTHDATGDHIIINMNATQLALLDQAYSALKESVYDALVVQTRLKPHLDDISLTLDGGAWGEAANDEVFWMMRVE